MGEKGDLYLDLIQIENRGKRNKKNDRPISGVFQRLGDKLTKVNIR